MAGFKKTLKTKAKNVKQALKPSARTKKKLKKAAKYTAIGLGAAAAVGGAAYLAYNASQGGPKVDTPSTYRGIADQVGQVTTIGRPTEGNIRGSKHTINYQISNDLGRAFESHLGPSLPNSSGSNSLFSPSNLQRMRDREMYKKKHSNLSSETVNKLADMRGSYKASQPQKVSEGIQAKLAAARNKQKQMMEMNRIQNIPGLQGQTTMVYGV